MANRFFVLTRAVNDNRVDDSVVADYVFLEGGGDVVTDIVGGSNLTITNGHEWVADMGVGVDGLKLTGGEATVLDSVIQTACRASNQVTLEAWVTPTNTTQGDSWPARIMTMAPDPLGASEHAFMLGMGNATEETQVRCRLRTDDPSVDDDGALNGSALFSANGVLTAAVLHHVVASFVGGILSIYVDSNLVASTPWPGTFSNWPDGASAEEFFGFAIGNEFGAHRPFLGTYHRVAVHSRGISAEEVLTNYTAGPLGGGELPPPNIRFETSFDNVFESAGSVSVNVVLSRQADPGGVAYSLSVDPSSSMEDSTDYSLVYSGSISEGDTVDDVTINIVNDSTAELTETLILDLLSSGANVTGAPRYTLTVEDDDTLPVVSFDNAAASLQTTSSEATFAVQLDRPFSSGVTISYTLAGSTAAGAVVPGDLVIPAGATSGQSTVAYTSPVESTTIVVGFSALLPPGVVAGTIPTKTFTFIASGFAPIFPGADFNFSMSQGTNLISSSAPAGDFTQQPYRTYLEPGKPDSFVLSVFAGHHSGMNRVTFQINGGDAVDVFQTELDTDFAHKFFELTDHEVDSKGIEVYGVRLNKAAYPKGRYRCLANKIATNGSIEQIDFEFWTDPDGDDGRVVRYVQSGGTGDGLTNNTPSNSFKAVIDAFSAQDAEGAIIYLMPGPTVEMESRITSHANDRPIDIRNHPDSPKANIAKTNSVFLRIAWQDDRAYWPKRVTFDGIGMDRVTTRIFANWDFTNQWVNPEGQLERDTSNPAQHGVRLMWDNCYVTAAGTSYNQQAAIDAVNQSTGVMGFGRPYDHDRGFGMYMSNTVIHDVCNGGLSGFYSLVNVEQGTGGGSMYRRNAHVLNCHAWNGRVGNDISWHPDTFHYIVFDKQLYRPFWERCGWTASQVSANHCPGQHIFVVHAIDDLIISNVLVLSPQPTVHSPLIVPGRYPAGGALCNGYVLAHYTQPYWSYRGAGEGSFAYPVSQFQDNWMHSVVMRDIDAEPPVGFMRTEGHSHGTPGNPFPGVGLVRPANGQQPSGWTWGDDHDATWVNPAVTYNLSYNYYPNQDYTPKAGGPLISRTSTEHKHTPRYDLYGNLRGDGGGMTAIGAIRGQNENG